MAPRGCGGGFSRHITDPGADRALKPGGFTSTSPAEAAPPAGSRALDAPRSAGVP